MKEQFCSRMDHEELMDLPFRWELFSIGGGSVRDITWYGSGSPDRLKRGPEDTSIEWANTWHDLCNLLNEAVT